MVEYSPTICPQTPPPSPHHHPWIYWRLFYTNSPPLGWPGISQWGLKEYWKVRFNQMTKVYWDSPSRPMPVPVVISFDSVPLFKSYSWFSLTQMDRHTNSIQNKSPHCHIRVRAEFFFYLSQNVVSEQSKLIPCCSDKVDLGAIF